MKNFCSLLFLLSSLSLSAQNILNIDLFGQVNRGDERYSGSWAYIAPDGSEYALIGAKTGTAVYSIDAADDITELGFIPGPATNWREITVIEQHAYVVTDVQDTGHTMQVIDLSNLPDGISLVTEYNETFQMGHIIGRDIYSDAPYVYVHGADSDDGTHILDVSDPANPVEVGVYAPGYYIHDGHIKGDYLYACAFNETQVDVVNISDKTNPILEAIIPDPGDNTHSAWLTEDSKYLFVADEQDGVESTIFNVEDLTDATPVARVLANELSLLHNPYICDEWAFCAHNTEGLIVYDIADPTLPVQVAQYDTFDGMSGGFKGLWSACPYFPSGKIIGADRTQGLFVWTFNDTRAVRFRGVVKDSISGEILADALVTLNAAEDLPLSPLAEFRYGTLAGDFTLTAGLAGYDTKTFSFTLAEGEEADFTIELVPDDFVSTDDAASQKPLRVFPNPFNALLSVEIPEEMQTGELILYDAVGQIVQRVEFSEGNYLTLETGNLAEGIYFLEAVGENNSRKRIKIVK